MPRPLFEAWPEVAERIVRAPHLLVCLDFDGTLAPLVDDPTQVELPEEARRLLASAATVEAAAVAVVSGRNRNDLIQRIGLPGLYYVGNHGFEISGPGVLFVEPTSAACTEPLRLFADGLAPAVQNLPGVWVENKGLTLSVHHRLSPPAAAEEVRRMLHGALAKADHPFHLTSGDKVYEIRPRVCWDKGAAVEWLRDRLGKPDVLTIYVGDDVTDEDAFAVLREGIGVKVGRTDDTKAHYQLPGPPEVLEFLHRLEGLLRSKARSFGQTNVAQGG